MRDVEIFEFSRLNFEYALLSKRKLQSLVDGKKVSGWDDPRFATFRGVLRKGLRV
jgi:glutamyl-tRNA synthetase